MFSFHNWSNRNENIYFNRNTHKIKQHYHTILPIPIHQNTSLLCFDVCAKMQNNTKIMYYCFIALPINNIKRRKLK